jgi:hypothetical protein
VRAGGVISIVGGVIALVGVFLAAAAYQPLGPGSIFPYSQFFFLGGFAIGLIGIGVALLGLPDG